MLRGVLSAGYSQDAMNSLYAKGYDIAGSINLLIQPDTQDSKDFYDAGDDTNLGVLRASWDMLRMGVGESRVKLGLTEDVTFRSEGINKEAFLTLASALRELKNSCHRGNMVGSEGEVYIYHVEGVNADADLKILQGDTPDMEGAEFRADIKTEAGEYREIHAEGRLGRVFFRVELDNDETYADKIYSPSNGYTWPEVLGWSEKKADVDYTLFGDSDDDFYTADQIQARFPERDYSWLKSADYEIVTRDNVEEVVRQLNEAVANKDRIAFDTETTGLNIRFTSKRGDGDRLVGLIFSIREDQGWFVPIRMNTMQNLTDVEEGWGAEYDTVRKYFKDVLENGLIVGHNVSFDWKVMWAYGINTNFVDDTMLIAHMGYCNEHRGHSASLKALTRDLLGKNALELGDISKSGDWSENNFADLPEETVRLYGCADGDDTLTLYNYFVKNNHFERYGLGTAYRIEVVFACVSGYQEYYGHHIAMDRIEELRSDVENGMAVSEAKLTGILGHECNFGSSQQLQKAMYETLGYPILSRTSKGLPSTNKATLQRLAEQKNSDETERYPFASELLRYRDWAKLKSNFVDVLDKLGTSDGYMFSGVKLPLETGRVAVSEPNYQSYNDVVKKYISPRPGYYMLDMDYSSVEYRILASMSGQENLIDNFKDPDTDYHTYQASRMFGVPYEAVTKDLRHQAKGINFGLPYGMGDANLGARIYGERNATNTARARDLRRLYFEGQEKVEEFFDTAREKSYRNSYAETYFGRRRYFDKRQQREDVIRREGANMAIQGTAADLFKLGMVNLFNTLAERGWLGRVLISAFVHDEALYEVSNDIDPADALKLVKDSISMESFTREHGWAPLYVGGGYGENWYHAKKTEIPVELQDELVRKYAGKWNNTGKGLDWWDGNIERLYSWEVEKNNEYYAKRVKKYLTGHGLSDYATKKDADGNIIVQDLKGTVVNPQVNTYALDMLKYLKGDAKEYFDKDKRDWVDDTAYAQWLEEGAPLGEEPVDQMDNAGWVLGLGRHAASDAGLESHSKENAQAKVTRAGTLSIDPVSASTETREQMHDALLRANGAGIWPDDGRAYIYFPESSSKEDFKARSAQQGTWESVFIQCINRQKSGVFGDPDIAVAYQCVVRYSNRKEDKLSVQLFGKTVDALREFYRRMV